MSSPQTKLLSRIESDRMIAVTIAVYAVTIVVSLPLLVLALECLLALMPARNEDFGDRKTCAVLIPAHNEEEGIGQTLANVAEQIEEGDRIIVVADNCSDRTAAVATRFGAEVVIRSDHENRGKGFALDAGVKHLRESAQDSGNRPEIVVILDADCTFAPNALDRIVRAAGTRDYPVQAQYLMYPRGSANASSRLSAFAFLTKNLVRARGLNRLRLSVPLTGSGMAFPWHLISQLQLGTSEIVEDLELGLKLVCQGNGPRFCESARVDSYFPESKSAAQAQRTRWEHGFLGQMRRQLKPLFRQALKGNVHAFAAALDLIVPPLSLLVLICLAAGAMLVGFYWLSLDLKPLVVFLVACSLASASLAAIWYRFGRNTISLKELFAIPVYAGSKLTMYLAVPFHAQREWNRTERVGDDPTMNHP